MSQRICVGVGQVEVEIPIRIPWWERLKERKKAIQRKYQQCSGFVYVEKDPCPSCGASFVHVVMLDNKHNCRKCGHTFDFRG